MSSVGEISLLYINKAHVMNENIITRRMMLLYMSYLVFSLAFTPLILRLLVPTNSIVEREANEGGERYKNTVKTIVATELELTTQARDKFSAPASDHLGLERRRKERASDPEEEDMFEDGMSTNV